MFQLAYEEVGIKVSQNAIPSKQQMKLQIISYLVADSLANKKTPQPSDYGVLILWSRLLFET